jgi:hypothetical protein
MAKPRTTAARLSQETSIPLNTYGIPRIPGWNQFRYDMVAFGDRLGVERGCPPRLKLFRQYADVLFPNHFEWHDWAYRFLEPLCRDEKKQTILVGFPGCSNCVAGHTRILNPLTGEQPTIKELVEKQIAPIVMTLWGTAQAQVPYVKGVDEIYEVTLGNGTKFSATAKHRVLASSDNASRFFHVGDLQIGQRLFSIEPYPHHSTSDTDLSVRVQDARHSPKTVVDFLASCHPDYGLCGEQLHSAREACLSFSPSQSDAQEHNQGGFYSDGLEATNKHSLFSSQFDHLSNSDDVSRHSFSDSRAQHLLDSKKTERVSRESRPCGRFHLEDSLGLPFSIRDSGSSRTRCCESVPVETFPISSCSYRVSQTTVVSIRKTGVETYYDIGVPGVEHYFAEGTIHHNSAKSFHAASFACAWWLAYPEESSVTFVSTTMKALRRRGWAEVQKCFSGMAGEKFGNFIDSRMVWQSIRGDDKHAVIGKAVEEGSTQKVADDIKGVHTKRQMFIIDEATSIPEAIYTACNNMYSYPDEFIMMVLGNPFSRLDQFGLFCEPENGWNSVTVDTGNWTAKPFAACGGFQPEVVTFDAEKSPNITEGKVVSRHLPKKEEVQAGYIAAGNGQTPLWWSNKRGFWPPEGLVKTVFTESMLLKFDGYGHHKFQNGAFSIITTLDQAQGGGDVACLRHAKIGTLEGGGWGIEAMPPIELPIKANDKTNPTRYQLSKLLQDHCANIEIGGAKKSCPPENVGIDDTADGGLGDIIYREWSHKVIRIQFQSGASEDFISLEDTRPAKEFCRNKRAEMFLLARSALQSGQLKGIDQATATEMCSIGVDDKNPAKVIIESKEDYRSNHGGKSCDKSDSLVMLLEVARIKGFQLKPVGQTAVATEDWQKDVKASQELYHEENLWQPEEMPEDDPVETFV